MKEPNKLKKPKKPKEPKKPKTGKGMAKKKEPDKVRFVFGKDMSIEEMVDAVVRMAKEYGIEIVDDRKERGVPIVDSRKKRPKKR